MFGRNPKVYYNADDFLASDLIFDGDKEKVNKLIYDVAHGKERAKAEFRMRHVNGKCLWVSVSVVVVFNIHKEPIKAISIIDNIDKQIKETLKLKQEAMKDPLTGILNRMTFEQAVELFLETHTNVNGAFIMFDIDHFKAINDIKGHAVGDAALKDIVQFIRDNIRETDLFARMGGDEFALFFRGSANFTNYVKKAKYLVEHVAYMHTDDGNTFFDLYRHADIALYEAKHSGGNCLVTYLDVKETL